MSIVFKIIGIGAVCAFLNAIFRKNQPEYAVFIPVAFGIIMLSLFASVFSQITGKVNAIARESNIDFTYLGIIVKVVGIAYVCEYSSAIFNDAGEMAVAKKIEFAGKAVIFILSLPVIESLFDMISRFF